MTPEDTTYIRRTHTYRSVLTIAGSDSGGGAGIQADLKTFSALGCFGTSAITAITVQNTRGVTGIHSVPPGIVQQQIVAVMDDIKPAAIKIGMVHTAELALAIAFSIMPYTVPVIFDPVMVATSGDRLIEKQTVNAMERSLFPHATLVTPNLDETEWLTGLKVSNLEDMKVAATRLLQKGCRAVLVKGGHLKGETLHDYFLDNTGREEVFTSTNINTLNTHGTGCTLASAIAAFMARGADLVQAIAAARSYVHAALDEGKDVQTGLGIGPLNHFYNPHKLIKYDLEC
ncbi:bifunctional hydroxymethylpyrimidine kinase/phosphomethylpyrimidine kinase [Chryseolinea lacunae]|uniref:hydroxymethylpyrimidine kinase n=1 Tax=Chryseolinea lacunae TaxID=2801331 RepID=A0ABS1KLL0_9BACT|nr:bifunctional hydroxymethylpyrimidine kinase/phosphomethylpyrimidine kinase [Chryseolinea lacunae]MBL0740349.1 bifunctional hydroxymethylpyrimidine kinase/phosphomethylpyrimidine kinase [Chryseolinea lacunae]